MRTIFTTGLGTERPVMGQDFGSIISTLLTSGAKYGLEWYTAKRATDRAKQAADKAQEQLKAAQDIQQKAQQTQQQAVQQQAAAAAAPLSAQNQILGMDPTTFYIGAGVLGLGAIVTTILATR